MSTDPYESTGKESFQTAGVLASSAEEEPIFMQNVDKSELPDLKRDQKEVSFFDDTVIDYTNNDMNEMFGDYVCINKKLFVSMYHKSTAFHLTLYY
ncbi:hypothetical protein JOB18_005114 [Solea senegalensis]|uniref:Uncharacterized protein n=1 Tax=Solea senegalensis TaxID=28829 RepID=A0AAV6QU15_SOLSE|nr:hypothetical protein JOB18_005114 [Solea senegalensis]